MQAAQFLPCDSKVPLVYELMFCAIFFQDHFEPSQFEEIARSPAGGKKLKPNAIPTLFSVRDPPYPIATPQILLPLKPEPGMHTTTHFF